ncbi:MAG: hypothetical protein ACYTDY_12490 [Planctomycetota bacterium]|jgi:hypothetical protein
MAEIEVSRAGPDTFRVVVSEGGGSTTHEVTATDEVVSRYGGEAQPEDLIHASFRFLLEREPKEAILRSFALPVIERYFGDYPRVIQSYLG